LLFSKSFDVNINNHEMQVSMPFIWSYHKTKIRFHPKINRNGPWRTFV